MREHSGIEKDEMKQGDNGNSIGEDTLIAHNNGNEIGPHDLAGNVQEWVSDNYGGPRDFRFRNHGVLRGGSYESFRPAQLNNNARIPVPADTQGKRSDGLTPTAPHQQKQRAKG